MRADTVLAVSFPAHNIAVDFKVHFEALNEQAVVTAKTGGGGGGAAAPVASSRLGARRGTVDMAGATAMGGAGGASRPDRGPPPPPEDDTAKQRQVMNRRLTVGGPAPGASGGAGGGGGGGGASQIMQDRRRLSVVSANPLVEGQQQRSDSHDDRRLGSMGSRGDDKRGAGGEVRLGGRRGAGNVCGTVVIEYAGVSLKGYAPYNMKKENQVRVILRVILRFILWHEVILRVILTY